MDKDNSPVFINNPLLIPQVGISSPLTGELSRKLVGSYMDEWGQSSMASDTLFQTVKESFSNLCENNLGKKVIKINFYSLPTVILFKLMKV